MEMNAHIDRRSVHAARRSDPRLRQIVGRRTDAPGWYVWQSGDREAMAARLAPRWQLQARRTTPNISNISRRRHLTSLVT